MINHTAKDALLAGTGAGVVLLAEHYLFQRGDRRLAPPSPTFWALPPSARP